MSALYLGAPPGAKATPQKAISWANPSNATLSEPPKMLPPGAVLARTGKSSSVALGAAISTSKAHIVPWLTGCPPGAIEVPGGVHELGTSSAGAKPSFVVQIRQVDPGVHDGDCDAGSIQIFA